MKGFPSGKKTLWCQFLWRCWIAWRTGFISASGVGTPILYCSDYKIPLGNWQVFFKEGLSYFVIQETVFSSTVFTVLHSKLIQFCSILLYVLWFVGGKLLSRLVHLELTRGVIYFKHMGGYLISFKVKTIVSVFQKEPRIQSRKAWVQEVGGHAAEDRKQIRTSSWRINHFGSAHTNFYSRD